MIFSSSVLPVKLWAQWGIFVMLTLVMGNYNSPHDDVILLLPCSSTHVIQHPPPICLSLCPMIISFISIKVSSLSILVAFSLVYKLILLLPVIVTLIHPVCFCLPFSFSALLCLDVRSQMWPINPCTPQKESRRAMLTFLCAPKHPLTQTPGLNSSSIIATPSITHSCVYRHARAHTQI